MEDLNDKVSNGGATAAGKLANTEWNQPMSEVQSIIESTGQTLAAGTLTQLGDAIAAMTQGDSYFGTDTGSSIAYVVAAVNTVHYGAEVGLFTGMHCRFRPANTSTSTNPTLNAFSSGVKNILAENGAALVIGDLATTRDAECRYDGTQWILFDRSKALVVSGTYPRGHIRGFLMSNHTDTDHDIQMGDGECSNHDGTFNLDLTSAEVKQIDVDRDGNASGMFPSALTLSIDTWYKAFIIGGSTATTTWGVDTSSSATNIMNDATTQTGDTYDKYRQVGWLLTDGSSNLVQFWHLNNDANHVMWKAADPITSSAATTVEKLTTMQAPPFAYAEFTYWIFKGQFSEGRAYSKLEPKVMNDSVVTASNATHAWETGIWDGGGQGNQETSESSYEVILMDAVSQLRTRFDAVRGIQEGFFVRGYYYYRDRDL